MVNDMSEDWTAVYSAMWTTDLHRYGLLEVAPGEPVSCLIFDLALMAPMTFDEDDVIVDAVIEKMRSAGVRMLTVEETSRRPK